MNKEFDIIIIGGGINGAGIARDASGRGYSVALIEMNDLASGTSSWSTKLIHGGLRYMEQFQFRLVREALTEREKLFEIAPHIIRPLKFILPYSPSNRPAWIIQIGLVIYDYIAKRKYLASSKKIKLNKIKIQNPLQEKFKLGFEYSDCKVEDARLVILNALDAKNNKAVILTNTRVIKAKNNNGLWEIVSKSTNKKISKQIKLKSKVLVNASGPWTDKTISVIDKKRDNQKNTRLIKGSHIVVPKLYNHEKAYIFQHHDGRVIFSIPFEKNFTLIGTTDEPFQGNLRNPKISDEETHYLCEAASTYFKKNISSKEIIWTYSGVRSLFDDGKLDAKDITRDYTIEKKILDDLLYISVFGGKITTYRKLSEEVLKIIDKKFNKITKSWTAKKSLPGGDFSPLEFDSLLEKYKNRFPFIKPDTIERLFSSYGTNLENILGNKSNIKQLGIDFGKGLYECEVDYLIKNEWALTVSDIIWRRSKLGLTLNKAELLKLNNYIMSRT